MSDPRNTDPHRDDQWRRSEGSGSAGDIWPWIAAALAGLAALGLLYGYNRTEHASTQPSTTTGSAPSQSRPAPPAKSGDKSGDMPAPAPNQ
jgi:hypothetical protein